MGHVVRAAIGDYFAVVVLTPSRSFRTIFSSIAINVPHLDMTWRLYLPNV